MSKLAIVIPAYKSMYFAQALLSIANQTNKDFTLYIGDDCSPGNLYSIVEKYENRIPIVYKHFDENLGGKDLVAQWERCIDLVDDEEWIWLFSDDDTMDPTCVEHFYDTLQKYPHFDLFHFNVKKIDEFNNATVTQFFPFPEILIVEDFLLGALQPGYYSTAVEYIFRKSHFYNQGRFQNFDLAWCSDFATWIKLGKCKGIRNIVNSKVYWRESQINISSNNYEKEIIKRKLNAQIEFINWICNQAKENEINIEIITLKKLFKAWFFRGIKYRIKFLSFCFIALLILKLYLILDQKKPPRQKILFLYIYKIYRFLIGIIKNILFWKDFKLQKLKY
jgi:glycosyltransferase involved in cell wall biosynthesis